MTVHVVGAGIAGLACALRLARRGVRVVLHEQARAAGGRCRSYADPCLGRPLDSGIHLVLARHRSVHAFLAECAALDRLGSTDDSSFRFVDLRDRREWSLRLNDGPVPWWIAVPGRSIPGRGFGDMLGLARLALAGPDATVDACVPLHGRGHRRLWEPITVAWLNTPPAEASARLLWRVVREAFREGGAGFRPCCARGSLSSALIDPAVAAIAAHGGAVHFRQRVAGLLLAGDRAAALELGSGALALAPGDGVVLAVPPSAAARLVPGLEVPLGSSPIATVHYALSPAAPDAPSLACLIDGRSHWLLVQGERATLTVGGAAALMDEAPAALARRLWPMVAHRLGRDADTTPAFRVLKFRHGTFAHTPANVARRSGPRTRWSNLFLAGDWTVKDRPAMLDSAAQSGHDAAAAVLDSPGIAA